jgi:hypothetical protein
VVFVKALHIPTSSQFTLDGPKGRVFAMTVSNDILLAGAEVTTHTLVSGCYLDKSNLLLSSFY